jgi:hypothetical protein
MNSSLALALALALTASRSPTGTDNDVEAQVETTTAQPSKIKFFPVPMYTTVPTEGSTYGAMPVFLRVNGQGIVRMIGAPSVSWNSAAGVNGTLRFFYYPNRVRTLTVIAAASTHVNRTAWITYTDLPIEPGRPTVEIDGLVRRNIFYRFFGLGPESLASNQSSYTRTTAGLTGRWGMNVPGHLNLGARGTIRRDLPIFNPIFDLPATQDLFPTVPGISGAAMAAAELSLRFDTRAAGDYSANGFASELRGSYARGLAAFDHFWQVTSQSRALLQENAFMQSAGRLFWSRDFGGSEPIPFYYQPSLGGENMLRGFPEDRFFDRGAWEAEIEQRFRVLETHFYGVNTDWDVAPFVAVGQVYDRFDDIFSRVRVSVGAGFRAWVKPNVLGRVDVAYAGEGLNAYVVVGYPY